MFITGGFMQTIDEISRFAAVNCLDIYNDFTEKEVNKMPMSIQHAWVTGGRLTKKQEFLDSQDDT